MLLNSHGVALWIPPLFIRMHTTAFVMQGRCRKGRIGSGHIKRAGKGQGERMGEGGNRASFRGDRRRQVGDRAGVGQHGMAAGDGRRHANKACEDCEDFMGRSPLDLATEYQHLEVEKFLKSCRKELRRENSSLSQLRSQ